MFELSAARGAMVTFLWFLFSLRQIEGRCVCRAGSASAAALVFVCVFSIIAAADEKDRQSDDQNDEKIFHFASPLGLRNALIFIHGTHIRFDCPSEIKFTAKSQRTQSEFFLIRQSSTDIRQLTNTPSADPA